MKGLILKDLFVLKDTIKIYILFFLIYGYMGITQGQIAIMYTMIFLVSSLLPVTSISYDERCKWDRIANTMPVSRKDIVYSKYMLAFVLMVISVLFSGVVFAFEKNTPADIKLAALMIMAAVSILYQAVTIPSILKFGSEKGRFILIALTVLPILFFSVASKLNLFTEADIDRFMAANSAILPYVALAAVAVVYIVSVIISVNIYKKKDL